MLDTGALTNLVIEQITLGSAQLVGDGIAPTDGGWLRGQPNVDAFVPFTVVAFTGASVKVPGEMTLVKAQEFWLASFQLRYHGGSRPQTDWIAMEAREAVEILQNRQFGAVPYKVAFIEWRQLGGVVRNDVTDPPAWTATDNFTLQVSKA